MAPRLRRPLKDNTIAGVVRNRLLPSAQALPQSVDAAEQKYGLALYDDMEETSIEISLALAFLRDRLFEDGPQFLPNLPPPLPDADPNSEEMIEWAESMKAAAYINVVMENLADSGNDPELTYRQLFNAVKHGRAVAEKTYCYMRGEWSGWIGLSAFRYLPRENFAIVSDPFSKILGVLGIIPGKASAIYDGPIPDPARWSNWVSVDRLLVMVINPASTHPLGQSILRSAYRSWWSVRQVEPLELKSMGQFAGEGMLFTAGENGAVEMPVRKKDGTVEKMTQIDFALDVMEGYESGDIAILPHGFERVKVGGDGNAEGFEKFFDRHGRRMVARILYTATMLYEAQRNSNAQADKAENITDTAVRSIRKLFSRVLKLQLVKPLLVMNKGEAYAEKNCPEVAMAQMSAPDREKMLTAMAKALTAGVITRPMLPKLWREWLGEDYLQDDKAENSGLGNDEDDDETSNSRND